MKISNMNYDFPQIYPVTAHTDHVGQGSTFVVISGKKEDGMAYIIQAIEKGATTVVVALSSELSQDVLAFAKQKQVTIERVQDTRKELTLRSAAALGFPAKKLKIIGITGTKGKTSTAYLIYFLLRGLGKRVALLSTAEKLLQDYVVDMPLTTPLPDDLHMFFGQCVELDIEYVVMEVSAQALSMHRVYGLTFEAAAFTNFSMEHLEFYKNLDEYLQAKVLLFDQVVCPERMFINIDDSYGADLSKRFPACSTYSLQNNEASWFGVVEQQGQKQILQAASAHALYKIPSHLIGIFNMYNLLVATAIVDAVAGPLIDLADIVADMPQIPGRMEQYHLKNGAWAYIDYAHNPSSFQAVLSTLRAQTDHLIVVFGAGGNRDKQKRPMMGAIVDEYADLVIITSDNPRDEHPGDIAQDILAGFTQESVEHKVIQELNRTKAIELAYQKSRANSVIAILGKGRDEYQIIGKITFPFKERSIIKPFLKI